MSREGSGSDENRHSSGRGGKRRKRRRRKILYYLYTSPLSSHLRADVWTLRQWRSRGLPHSQGHEQCAWVPSDSMHLKLQYCVGACSSVFPRPAFHNQWHPSAECFNGSPPKIRLRYCSAGDDSGGDATAARAESGGDGLLRYFLAGIRDWVLIPTEYDFIFSVFFYFYFIF